MSDRPKKRTWEEQWRTIHWLGAEGDYWVSSHGKVKSFRRNITGKYLKQGLVSSGYRAVNILNKTMTVHRLVLRAFVKMPSSRHHCNHIDGNKLNNSLENLEWVTRKQNAQHAIQNGLYKVGSDVHCSKLTNDDVIFMRELRKSGFKLRELEDIFGINNSTASNICLRKKWKHLK